MTSEIIELAAARAVHKARLLERAVHDRGPWQIEINGIREDAFHVICPTRVVLAATFPEVCWVTPPDAVSLYCKGQLVDSKLAEIPCEGSFRIEWSLVAEPTMEYV